MHIIPMQKPEFQIANYKLVIHPCNKKNNQTSTTKKLGFKWLETNLWNKSSKKVLKKKVLSFWDLIFLDQLGSLKLKTQISAIKKDLFENIILMSLKYRQLLKLAIKFLDSLDFKMSQRLVLIGFT